MQREAGKVSQRKMEHVQKSWRAQSQGGPESLWDLPVLTAGYWWKPLKKQIKPKPPATFLLIRIRMSDVIKIRGLRHPVLLPYPLYINYVWLQIPLFHNAFHQWKHSAKDILLVAHFPFVYLHSVWKAWILKFQILLPILSWSFLSCVEQRYPISCIMTHMWLKLADVSIE